MNSIVAPRIVICGTSKNSRAGALALGLIYELNKRGLGVSCCMVGANLHAAALLRSLVGRYVPCLDRRLLSQEQVVANAYLASIGADILLVISEAGLYDGIGSASLAGSPAEIAWLLSAPVLLCCDAGSYGNSIGAMLKGYLDLAEGFAISGLCTNELGGGLEGRNGSFYRECLNGLPIPPLWGGLTRRGSAGFALPESIGQTGMRSVLDRQFLIELGEEAGNSVKVDALITAAEMAPCIEVTALTEPPTAPFASLAVADDSCFGLCYQENFELLRYHGIQLLPFSPLADQQLPPGVQGVYFPGGFVAACGAELAMNTSLHAELREFAGRGGFIYAEGGSTAYLSQRFELDLNGTVASGVGIFPGTARLIERDLAYLNCKVLEDSLAAAKGGEVPVLFGSGWKITAERIWDFTDGQKILRTFEMPQKSSVVQADGLTFGDATFGTFGFINFTAYPELVRRLAHFLGA